MLFGPFNGQKVFNYGNNITCNDDSNEKIITTNYTFYRSYLGFLFTVLSLFALY